MPEASFHLVEIALAETPFAAENVTSVDALDSEAALRLPRTILRSPTIAAKEDTDFSEPFATPPLTHDALVTTVEHSNAPQKMITLFM